MKKLAQMVTLAVLATIAGATTADVSINETVFTKQTQESDEMSTSPPVTELTLSILNDKINFHKGHLKMPKTRSKDKRVLKNTQETREWREAEIKRLENIILARKAIVIPK